MTREVGDPHDAPCYWRCGLTYHGGLDCRTALEAALARWDVPAPAVPGEDSPWVMTCCGATVNQPHNLSCEYVTVEQFRAEVPAPAAPGSDTEGTHGANCSLRTGSPEGYCTCAAALPDADRTQR